MAPTKRNNYSYETKSVVNLGASMCFRHAGFYPAVTASSPEEWEEDSLLLTELTQRLNSVVRVTELGRPFTQEALDHVLTEDEGLETGGTPTNEDIIRMVQEENKPTQIDIDDEDPEQQPPKIYSYKEFNEAMQLVEGVSQYQHGKEAK